MGVEYKHFLIPEDNTYRPGPDDLSGLVSALLDGGFVTEGSTDTIRQMTCDPGPAGCNTEKVWCYIRLGNGKNIWFACPCSAGDIATLGEQDFQLVWSVGSSHDSGLTYPLQPFPEWGDAYYDLELHMARDFVCHTSELIDLFGEVACACGRDLRYSEWDGPSEAELIESDPILGRYFYKLSDEPPRLPLYSDSRIHRLCPACGKPFRPQELVARVRDGWTGKAMHRPGGATYLFAVVIDCGKRFARTGWPIRATEEFMETVTQALGQKFYEIGDID